MTTDIACTLSIQQPHELIIEGSEDFDVNHSMIQHQFNRLS